MFITLEGIEGSGKTSQVRHICDFLNKNGHDCVSTREPGGTKIGEKIRAILLDPESKAMAPAAELLLYAADRAQHIKEFIGPVLDAGKTVVCDRYFDATVVYQGYARGLDTGLIYKIHQWALDDLKPDITFLLDLSPETGLSRAWKQIDNGSRVDNETRFEEEKLTFHEKVRDGYLDLAKREPKRFLVVDASQTEDKVREDIISLLSDQIIG